MNTDTNKDPVQVLSKIIVDTLTSIRIKHTNKAFLKKQKKLYKDMFDVTGPFQRTIG
ncbi:hypothetical protein KBB05_01105 [Patescibacteria group bacterium]|nr:hypothetical protein [Patescibacteria group bacterium]